MLGRIPAEVEPRQFEIRRGHTEEARLVVRAGHPLLSADIVTLDALRDFTFVTQRTGAPIRTAAERAFLMASLSPPANTIETSSLVFTMAYVRDSDAVAIVTAEVCELILGASKGPLRELALATPIVLDPFHLLVARSRGLTPIGSRMLDLLTDSL